ncbi:MAG: hydroxymethylbilane synthase [Actinomycetota bacterium]
MADLRIGTRRSELAMVQAEHVRDLLAEHDIDAEIAPMTTSGDEGAAATASPSGLKGLWIDTILDALRTGEIDLAVHSAKDLPAEDEEDLVIGAVPERADPHDVLIMREPGTLGAGMVVGTASLRRRAQIQAAFPGVGVVDLRGNVPTRLRKLAEGEVDATILAAAGLDRLGQDPPHTTPLGLDVMIPAPGQGCLAVQCRAEDRTVRAALMLLEHRASRLALETERALMRRIGGGCALPLGAIAAVSRDDVELVAVVASPDGVRVVRAAARGEDLEEVATTVAQDLLSQGADAILAEVGPGIGQA